VGYAADKLSQKVRLPEEGGFRRKEASERRGFFGALKLRRKKECIVERDCIFCKIAHGEAPADIVCQGDELVAFKDINPSAPVHVLVIPKKHVRSINDLKDEDGDLIPEMFLMARKIVKEQGIAQSGYKLIFNVERGGGQLVFHLHLHILGGWGQKRYPHLSDMPV